jgi:hypothetical protein
MISPFHEFIKFPRRLSPMPRFTDASFDPKTAVQYEVITMKRQAWAFDGQVSGIRRIYYDPVDGFTICEGFRCEVCNRTFFATELDDYAHECMEPVNWERREHG